MHESELYNIKVDMNLGKNGVSSGGINRRQFLAISTAPLALGVAKALCGGLTIPGSEGEATSVSIATVATPSTPESSKESPISSEVLKPQVAIGFNTHMYEMSNKPNENLTLEQFMEDVDWMALNGFNKVRLNIREWDIVGNGSTKENFVWNEAGLMAYEEAINHANEKGVEVNLVTFMPGFAGANYDYSIEAYNEAAVNYYTGLATRFKGKVAVWQIANEPDDHSFWNYANINRMDGEGESKEVYMARYERYLKDYASFVLTASETIKSIDPEAKVTVNVSKWVLPDGGIPPEGSLEETMLFNAVCGYEPLAGTDGTCKSRAINYITLDLYPDLDDTEISRYPEMIKYFKDRYGLPVVIGELGLSTTGGWKTPEAQAESINRTIDSLMNGEVRPEAIYIYELRDEVSGVSGEENLYGLINPDGSVKSSFEPVVRRVLQVVNQNN